MSNKTRTWNVDAVNCEGTGQTLECNLFATHKGSAELEIVSQTLSCGCILLPGEEEEPDNDEWLLKS